MLPMQGAQEFLRIARHFDECTRANSEKKEQVNTQTGKRETQSRRFPFKKNPCVPKEEQQILYQDLLLQKVKLNFAHQTSSHTHAHEKLCL